MNIKFRPRTVSYLLVKGTVTRIEDQWTVLVPVYKTDHISLNATGYQLQDAPFFSVPLRKKGCPSIYVTSRTLEFRILLLY